MIQTKTIDGVLLRDMVVTGAALLEKNREAVDALNVFPVPDGDTGTNMSLTMASATKEVNQKEYLSAGEAAAALAKGALRGARGNSGVITSQLYRGFARALEGVERITPTQFAQALKRGAETAYKAVMKPKEGTILTVARVIAEEAVKQAERAPEDYDALFANILSTGDTILKKTQQMLPALTQAGVVDAGGRGLLLIYMGYAACLRGEEVPTEKLELSGDGTASFEDDHDAIGEIKFAYCTEFLIQNLYPDILEEDIDSFRRRLNRIGDCVLVNKFVYGIKIPFTDDYLVDIGEPERGDVVVFEFPLEPAQDYIKRIVGVPGDVIAVRDKQLYVNGQKPDEPYVIHTRPAGTMAEEDNFGPFTVPAGEYFMMGDNRDDSYDSRKWGTVKRNALVGKAWRLYWSWENISNIRWGRIGEEIK